MIILIFILCYVFSFGDNREVKFVNDKLCFDDNKERNEKN